MMCNASLAIQLRSYLKIISREYLQIKLMCEESGRPTHPHMVRRVDINRLTNDLLFFL